MTLLAMMTCGALPLVGGLSWPAACAIKAGAKFAVYDCLIQNVAFVSLFKKTRPTLINMSVCIGLSCRMFYVVIITSVLKYTERSYVCIVSVPFKFS